MSPLSPKRRPISVLAALLHYHAAATFTRKHSRTFPFGPFLADQGSHRFRCERLKPLCLCCHRRLMSLALSCLSYSSHAFYSDCISISLGFDRQHCVSLGYCFLSSQYLYEYSNGYPIQRPSSTTLENCASSPLLYREYSKGIPLE
jgi:hypothetical protein